MESPPRYFKQGRRVWSHKSVIALLDKFNRKASPDELIRDCARELVARALSMQWSGPPYDPKILAGLRGIEVEETQEDIRADARILPKSDDTLLIQYDSTKPATRINFSICHEISHTFFPDCFECIQHRHKERDHNYELECLCDLGAAELLMPHERFQNDLGSADISLNLVQKLSQDYEASNEAVLIRIAQLSTQPCAVVFLSEKLKPAQKQAAQTMEFDFGFPAVAPKLRVDYVSPSKSFDLFIPPNKSVPDDSIAYKSLDSDDIMNGTEQWDIKGFGSWNVQAVKLPHFKKEPRRVATLIIATV